MTQDEALRKVKKLLAVAHDGRAPEAVTMEAIRKAQELMERHQIEEAMVQANDSEQDTDARDLAEMMVDEDPCIQAGGGQRHWPIILAQTVAEHHGCTSVYSVTSSGTSRSYLVGRRKDVQAARYMVWLLAGEVNRLARQNARGVAWRSRQSYKLGIVSGIGIALQNARDDARSAMERGRTGLELVLVGKAVARVDRRKDIAKAYRDSVMETENPRDSARPTVETDWWIRGVIDGRELDVQGRASGAVGAGSRQLEARP